MFELGTRVKLKDPPFREGVAIAWFKGSSGQVSYDVLYSNGESYSYDSQLLELIDRSWDDVASPTQSSSTVNHLIGNEDLPLKPKSVPRLLILGTGRSGKDTLSEYLANKYSIPFKSSSEFMAHLFYPFLKDILGYTSPEECYEDRHSCRALWYELIKAYNRRDPTMLARKILEDNNIYCGMRSKVELEACKRANLFDLVIWVDASDRVTFKEDESSCDVSKEDADIVLTNNGTEQEFYRKIDRLMNAIGVQPKSIKGGFEHVDPILKFDG